MNDLIINNFYKTFLIYMIMKHKYQKALLTCILIAYTLVMIIGAIIPNPSDVPVFSGNTKYFHFVGFIVLAIMVFKTFELYKIKHENILSIIALIFFIILTEVLQLFVSTRHFAYTDMLIDTCGCLIGYGIYRRIFSKK